MHRYFSNVKGDEALMLKEIGVESIDELFADIPKEIRLDRSLEVGPSLTEIEVKRKMESLGAKNSTSAEYASFIGAGVYDHITPVVIDHILSRSEFYTAYTPYQPEISQGTLQAIFEYQSLICNLTGMDASNASMYDGPTAAAEALLLALANKSKATKVLVSEGVHPEIMTVISTYLKFRNVEIVKIPLKGLATDLDALKELADKEAAAVLIQSPNFFGVIEDVSAAASIASEVKALTIDYVDPISLGLLKAPGDIGVDIVIGDGQSLGNGLNFGGPYLGFMAVTKKLVRKLPGRIAGETVDKDGKRAFVLTLQAREQHIRRFKATSNICSNQALNALAASIYMNTMGKQGFREVAFQSLSKAEYLKDGLLGTGKFEKLSEGPTLKEFALRYKGDVTELLKELKKNGIFGGYHLVCEGYEDGLLIAVTEKRTKEELDRFIKVVEVM